MTLILPEERLKPLKVVEGFIEAAAEAMGEKFPVLMSEIAVVECAYATQQE